MLRDGEGYQLVKEVLKNSKSNDWKAINGRLKARMEEKEYKFTEVTFDYIVKLSLESKLWENEKEKKIFKGMFYEKLKKEQLEEFIVGFAMVLEGIDDIMDIDIMGQGGKRIIDLYLRHIYFLANSNSPILIIGETGTSKEFLAKALHLISERPMEKFVEINCAAIPEWLLESELFGHERGSFTGAIAKKIGRFSEGNGGTFFLDEIGKMALHHQAKVLKAIDEKAFTPIGGKLIKIDAKFIAAAQPIDISERHIHPDLLYRLGFPDIIKMPTLNERLLSNPKGIIENSLERTLEKNGLDFSLSIAPDALDMLKKFNYKGNYRELENILRYAAISSKAEDRKEILPKDLKFQNEGNNVLPSKTSGRDDYFSSIKDVPLKNIIEHADKIRASIVEAKVRSIMEGGRSLRQALAAEGLQPKQYQNLIKKFRTITGKNLRSLDRVSS
jgi:transcriptional regulator with GAF, ATPase, and Fis domain